METAPADMRESGRFRVTFVITALMDTLFSLGCFAAMYYVLSSVTTGVIAMIAFNALFLVFWCVRYARPPRNVMVAANVVTTGVGLIGSLIVGFSLLGGWPWMAVAMGLVFVTTMFILVRDLDDHMSLGLLILFGFGQALAIIGGIHALLFYLAQGS